ncbi:unnamed protein product [Durusdinium trenchii]|uniref:Uncharacterized protein n=1 Tax=Durusdinium trenchii TaxID=1381693 RepID=A0ABP0R977_9DINO
MAVLQLRAVQSLRVEAAKRRAGVQGLRARSRAPETVPVPAEALEGTVAELAEWLVTEGGLAGLAGAVQLGVDGFALLPQEPCSKLLRSSDEIMVCSPPQAIADAADCAIWTSLEQSPVDENQRGPLEKDQRSVRRSTEEAPPKKSKKGPKAIADAPGAPLEEPREKPKTMPAPEPLQGDRRNTSTPQRKTRPPSDLEELLQAQERRIQELEEQNALLQRSLDARDCSETSGRAWAAVEVGELRKGQVISYQLDLIDAWKGCMIRSAPKVSCLMEEVPSLRRKRGEARIMAHKGSAHVLALRPDSWAAGGVVDRFISQVALITKVSRNTSGPSFALRCESGGVDFVEGSCLRNVKREPAVQRAVEEVLRQCGRIDVLVQAAGITGKTNVKTHEVDVNDFQRVFDVNVKAVFLCAKTVLPSMLKAGYGRIVNIASISGKDGNAGMLAYSSSKAAVINLTKVMGKDYAASGKDITINCIAPAVVQTAMVDAMPPEQVKYMTDKIPMGRTAKLEEDGIHLQFWGRTTRRARNRDKEEVLMHFVVAATVLFAASGECSFTTGFCFDASGGRTVY